MEYRFKDFRILQNEKSFPANSARQYLPFDKTVAADVIRFHKSLPGYAPAPLAALQEQSAAFGIKGIYCKDESHRFGLNAFKGLGGSYAMFRILCEKLGLDYKTVDYRYFQKDEVRKQCAKIHFVTATDGNHGKGVSWAAKLFGCSATVFMPKGSVEARRVAIEEAGNATAEITEYNYDQAVEHSWNLARKNDWILIQDTAWDGYEQYPEWIIDGYLTLAAEAEEQLGNIIPTHVFLQAGVGAMAGGVLEFLLSCYRDKPPVMTIVEPTEAACIYHSAKSRDGRCHSIDGNPVTIMAGLNCGTPCRLTWPAIRDKATFFCACDDIITEEGMRAYANPIGSDKAIIAGESGAVTYGLLNRILQDNTLRNLFRINADSVVLLINTEGDTDPEGYQRIVYGNPHVKSS
ncbi:L-threonine ammonia-lyase [Succiniclasticum ruminis]|uniref:L-threonine ammonia-lyase n=1 Tax=Succiniclasticum ruminis TaxID=40841 RepID=A0A1G6KBG2_9FIRM|nr:diaminopropionate ammonia-lyase [Succiniclasticum ruminis]SDC28304.1 L-threonine ammonia-lyase [Succiniclasticum ruminis]